MISAKDVWVEIKKPELLKDDDPSKLGHKKIWNVINKHSILFNKQFLIRYKLGIS